VLGYVIVMLIWEQKNKKTFYSDYAAINVKNRFKWHWFPWAKKNPFVQKDVVSASRHATRTETHHCMGEW
jgi:hypothetical protein